MHKDRPLHKSPAETRQWRLWFLTLHSSQAMLARLMTAMQKAMIRARCVDGFHNGRKNSTRNQNRIEAAPSMAQAMSSRFSIALQLDEVGKLAERRGCGIGFLRI